MGGWGSLAVGPLYPFLLSLRNYLDGGWMDMAFWLCMRCDLNYQNSTFAVTMIRVV